MWGRVRLGYWGVAPGHDPFERARGITAARDEKRLLRVPPSPCLQSRALGDFQYKDKSLKPENYKVTPVPATESVPRSDEDEFLVLACDGIWDVMDKVRTTPREACEHGHVFRRVEREHASVIFLLGVPVEGVFAGPGIGSGMDDMHALCGLVRSPDSTLEGHFYSCT